MNYVAWVGPIIAIGVGTLGLLLTGCYQTYYMPY